MFTPPSTGNEQLDSFLYQVYLDSKDNTDTGISINKSTGVISDASGAIIGYYYRYMHVKYAMDNLGTGMSDSPTDMLYYGIHNSDTYTESTIPADYTWFLVNAGAGFSNTDFLWYKSVGGRVIYWSVAPTSPDTGWAINTTPAIDLDFITTVSAAVGSFFSYFTPNNLSVPLDALSAPVFTSVIPALYSLNVSSVVQFVASQTDADAAFVNNTWRIGGSDVTGYGSITKTGITIGDPVVVGDHAEWPIPTAMPTNAANILVPVRYRDATGNIFQTATPRLTFAYVYRGADGTNGLNAPGVDISGYTSFEQDASGLNNPTTATLTALTQNIVSPTYAWSVTGGTPATATGSVLVVTPNTSTNGVAVSLTVSGVGISPITKTVNLPVVYRGAVGQAGSNGNMAAYPCIYKWTSTSTPPTRPSTGGPYTYTWSDGTYTYPSAEGWSNVAPNNTTPGSFLWEITAPVVAVAPATTTAVDWNNVALTIRAVAYNGNNGTTGNPGDPGTNGAGTYSITRTANDSSAPADLEVSAVIGRNPIAGDICTVQYNTTASANAVGYRYTVGWALFNTYLSGSLIVQNTITGDKLVAHAVTADKIDVNGDITISSGGKLIGGTITDGVYLGNTGLYGKKGGVTQFSVDNSGNAYFGGTLASGVVSNTSNGNAAYNTQTMASGSGVLTYRTGSIAPLTTEGNPIILWVTSHIAVETGNTLVKGIQIFSRLVIDGSLATGGQNSYLGATFGTSIRVVTTIPTVWRSALAAGAHTFEMEYEITPLTASGGLSTWTGSSNTTSYTTVAVMENKA